MHVSYTHMHLFTTAHIVPKMPRTRIVEKQLTPTDVQQCFCWPSNSLSELPGFNDNHHVEFKVLDTAGKPWTFVCCTRRTGQHAKPVLRGEWLRFVEEKGLGIGDIVIFYSNGAFPCPSYEIRVVPNGVPVHHLRLFGNDVY
uniref:TF-B3 domain-containing protein n=1 Tax=Opuntia streptacantha TaxID=393608 RepID=A0A7C9CQZ9_OPUST